LGALERNHAGDAVENIGLDAAGHALLEDFRGGRTFIGAAYCSSMPG
jgi:hypothetical protein